MCPALCPAPAQVGPRDTHMALDGEDLRSELLDANVEVSDLSAAALEAVPKLGRAGGPFLQLEAGEGVAVRGAHCVPPGPPAPPSSSPLASPPSVAHPGQRLPPSLLPPPRHPSQDPSLGCPGLSPTSCAHKVGWSHWVAAPPRASEGCRLWLAPPPSPLWHGTPLGSHVLRPCL